METSSRLPSPLTTFIIAWSIPTIVLISGIAEYHWIPYSLLAFIFLISGISLFFVGFKFSKYNLQIPNPTDSKRLSLNDRLAQDIIRFNKLITILALMGILASILFSIEMLFVIGIRPGDFMGIRETFVYREATIFSRLAAIFAAGGFFSLVAVICGWDYISKPKRFLWLISPLSLMVFSWFSAGRQTVFQLVIIMFFAILIRRRDGQKNNRFGILFSFSLVAIIVVGYSMVVASQRSGRDVEGKKIELLSTGFDASLNQKIENTLINYPTVLRDGIGETVFYFTHSIPSFFVFYELPRPGPYFGLWELPFLARRLGNLGIVETSVTSRVQKVYAYYAISGRNPQVWQTTFRDLIIDFGEIGTLVITTFLGYISGRVYRLAQLKGGLITIFLLVGILVICFYFPLFSIISDTLVFFYMIIATILYIRYESRYSRQVNSHHYALIDFPSSK